MNNRATMIGTLLLMGAVFLSLNALAASARPGDGTTAEKMTSIPVAILPGATASETIMPAEGLVAVPVPPPTLNPILIGSSRDIAMHPAMVPIEGPAAAPGPGISPPSASVRETQGVTTGPGMYPNNPGQIGPVLPGNGIFNPGLTPVPVPPLTPGMGKVTPVPTPPYSVDPVRNSH